MIDNEFTVMSEPCLGKNTDPNCKGCCNGFENVGSANIRPNYPDPPTDCNGLCDIRDCHNPLHNYLIKFGVMGLNEKFVGQAYVMAHNLKEAQCVFGTQSAFNGMQQRLKITSITEVPPCPEPILVQEDSVAIIDKRQLKTYPFLLKSDFQIFVADVHQQIINGFSTPSHLLFNINGVQVGDYHPLHDVDTIINLNNVTTTEDGLMSKEDKIKLDALGINTSNTEALLPANEIFNNVINLHKISKTGTFSDLLSIPDGKLTIQKNGTKIDDFVDNADTDKTINVVVNDGQLDIKYNNQSLGTFTADQATDTNVSLPLIKHKGTLITLDNNNSLNIPTEIDDTLTTANDKTWSIDKIKLSMPTVNNATLLIQQNGTNVESFTANDNTNKIANIIVPTKTSDLTNDGEGDVEEINGQMIPLKYITRLANNLQYYYTKSEIDALIAPNLRYDIVQTLPTQNISPTTIYLVPNGSSDTTNYYDEYLYIATASTPYWELIGSTRIDLTPYQTKTLSTPIVVDGVSQTTVEAVLSALNTLLNNHTHSWNDITNKPTIPTITFRQWTTTTE